MFLRSAVLAANADYDRPMSTLLAQGIATSRCADSRIGFATQGGDNWPAWDRFLTLDGQQAYHIGNICGTCAFFFERLQAADHKLPVPQLVARFRDGIRQLDRDLLDEIAAILPAGEYHAMLLQCVPQLVLPAAPEDYFCQEQVSLWGVDPFVGSPHSPGTEYYRTGTPLRSGASGLFEFIVPLLPRNQLHADTVASYKVALAGGVAPTALAISVLDVKQPSDWQGDPAMTSHWCLAHYLLDGHHKALAAAELGLPITMLSFLAVEKGISSREQIAQMTQLLGLP